ncbi:MAG: gamma-glutamyl-gamma-aminobutyrate hydrolase family protein [Pirellulaceae bacterium]
MLSKPLIGINADYRPTKGNQPAFSVVTAGYYDNIIRAGGIPVIVPPLTSEDDISATLEKLDGFLLVGGADLDPQKDGFMMHPAVRPMDERREAFDRTLCRMICERRMPVFGIGVGMQLLNVTLGGNLFLHIPEDLPESLPHKDPQDPGHRHGLVIAMGSIMERVYGDGEIRVSSRHHMAIDELAAGFRVTAKCADGVIEAIESTNSDWFAMGTQFHPENEAASALDVRIFEEFIDGIREQAPVRLRIAA